jgi:hypothetical protein
VSLAEGIEGVLFERLEQMRTADGYHYDWTWYRGRAPIDPPAKPAGLLVCLGETVEDGPDPLESVVLSFELNAVHAAPDSHDADPHPADVCSRLGADVKRCVGRTRLDTTAMGELRTYGVSDLRVTRVVPVPDYLGDGSAVTVVLVDVRYRHRIDDPDSVR